LINSITKHSYWKKEIGQLFSTYPAAPHVSSVPKLHATPILIDTGVLTSLASHNTLVTQNWIKILFWTRTKESKLRTPLSRMELCNTF